MPFGGRPPRAPDRACTLTSRVCHRGAAGAPARHRQGSDGRVQVHVPPRGPRRARDGGRLYPALQVRPWRGCAGPVARTRRPLTDPVWRCARPIPGRVQAHLHGLWPRGGAGRHVPNGPGVGRCRRDSRQPWLPTNVCADAAPPPPPPPALRDDPAETNKLLQDLCKKHKVDCSPPRTNARLLDKVCGRACCRLCPPPAKQHTSVRRPVLPCPACPPKSWWASSWRSTALARRSSATTPS